MLEESSSSAKSNLDGVAGRFLFYLLSTDPQSKGPEGIAEAAIDRSRAGDAGAEKPRQDARRETLSGRRVAVVVASYYESDPRVRRAAEAMIRAGMVLDVFCLRDPDATFDDETNPSVYVHRFPLPRRRAGMVRYVFEYAVFFAWEFSKLTISSFRRKYDLVHVHNLPDLLVFTSIVAKLRGSRIILDLHDPPLELCRTIFRLSPRHVLVRLAVVLEKCSVGFADVVFTPNSRFATCSANARALEGRFTLS